jgi:hypothetical protein
MGAREAGMTEAEPIEHEPWPVRAALLAVLGAACGLAFHLLTRGVDRWLWDESPLKVAAASFVAVGGVLFAFSLERRRWRWSAAFAVGGGSIVALVTAWNGSPMGWGADEGWQFLASLAAVAIAVPLFQAARDGGSRRVPVRAVHAHAWTNVILWFAACAFVGAAMLLTLLLSELFHLIGLDQLRDLLDEGWFMWPLAGAALGGAVGLFRDRDQVLLVLQRVVRAVFSVLAPVLALGLIVFVAALPFTGLGPLWSQTRSTTPILLVCLLGAVILVNAVAGNAPEEEARSRPLRWAAGGLIAVMLPLALVAAVSTGKRIGQYGYTPERLWAAVFVLAAAAFAVHYLVALGRGRDRWPDALRRANIRLGWGLCVLALFLALPIVSFGAVSARDQLGRLEAGRVAPEKFDWAAMRFDFGPAGRKALERLAASGPEPVRKRAAHALAVTDRSALMAETAEAIRPPRSRPRVTADAGAAIPAPLLDLVAGTGQCTVVDCRLVFDTPYRAILLSRSCAGCPVDSRLFEAQGGGAWTERESFVPAPVAAGGGEAGPPTGRVELRTVEKRQLFVDGQPVGPPLD